MPAGNTIQTSCSRFISGRRTSDKTASMSALLLFLHHFCTATNICASGAKNESRSSKLHKDSCTKIYYDTTTTGVAKKLTCDKLWKLLCCRKSEACRSTSLWQASVSAQQLSTRAVSISSLTESIVNI